METVESPIFLYFREKLTYDSKNYFLLPIALPEFDIHKFRTSPDFSHKEKIGTCVRGYKSSFG